MWMLHPFRASDDSFQPNCCLGLGRWLFTQVEVNLLKPSFDASLGSLSTPTHSRFAQICSCNRQSQMPPEENMIVVITGKGTFQSQDKFEGVEVRVQNLKRRYRPSSTVVAASCYISLLALDGGRLPKYFASNQRLWDENVSFCLTNHRKPKTNVTFMSMMSGCWFIPPAKFKNNKSKWQH